jgi:hypothetical protein
LHRIEPCTALTEARFLFWLAPTPPVMKEWLSLLNGNGEEFGADLVGLSGEGSRGHLASYVTERRSSAPCMSADRALGCILPNAGSD